MVTAHASFECHKLCEGLSSIFLNVFFRSSRVLGILKTKTSAPISGNMPHIASAVRQSKSELAATVTESPADNALTIFIEKVYRPVMSPTLNGNDALIRPGDSTLPNAIDMPMTAVPRSAEHTSEIQSRFD